MSRMLKHANEYYKIVVDALTAWEGDTSVGIVAPQLDVRDVKANITLASVRVRNTRGAWPCLRRI